MESYQYSLGTCVRRKGKRLSWTCFLICDWDMFLILRICNLFCLLEGQYVHNMNSSSRSKPNRSNVQLSAEAVEQVEAATRDYFDQLAPKHPTKPQRSKHDFNHADSSLSSGVNSIPELVQFQLLEEDTKKLQVHSENKVDDDDEEFTETEYYRDLKCVDKNHHTGLGLRPGVIDGAISISAVQPAGGQSNILFGEEAEVKVPKKIHDQKFAELTGTDIFRGDVPPGSAEKPLSEPKLKEMSGSNIFEDAKVESRDYLKCDGCVLPTLKVYMDVPVQVCETRDPKGLYKLARAGKSKAFPIGIWLKGEDQEKKDKKKVDPTKKKSFPPYVLWCKDQWNEVDVMTSTRFDQKCIIYVFYCNLFLNYSRGCDTILNIS